MVEFLVESDFNVTVQKVTIHSVGVPLSVPAIMKAQSWDFEAGISTVNEMEKLEAN
jgi:hypothetical protein